MRRRITLLVAATTSVVLLAFLLPAAALVSRVAEARAVDSGRQQVQALVPVVALGADSTGVATAVEGAARSGRSIAVVWPDGQVFGDASAVAAGPSPVSAETRREPEGIRLLQPVNRADGTATIQLFVPADVLRAGVDRTWTVLVGLGLLLFLLALLLADRLARSMTRPVRELAAVTDRLRQGDMTARASPAGPPEVRAVGTAVNRLAGRISELLAVERENAADLAHRLRTPLTALRLDAESLTSPSDRERLVADVDALARTVDAVIREARRPVREGVGARCDVTTVVADRVRFWAALAEEEKRPVRASLPSGPLLVRADAEDLGAALDALLGNVFAHTPEGTAFQVAVEARPLGGADVVVADEGPGFTGDALRRGASGAGSTGLGLDIVRRTAEASGGSLRLESGGPGTVVVLTLGPPAD